MHYLLIACLAFAACSSGSEGNGQSNPDADDIDPITGTRRGSMPVSLDGGTSIDISSSPDASTSPDTNPIIDTRPATDTVMVMDMRPAPDLRPDACMPICTDKVCGTSNGCGGICQPLNTPCIQIATFSANPSNLQRDQICVLTWKVTGNADFLRIKLTNGCATTNHYCYWGQRINMLEGTFNVPSFQQSDTLTLEVISNGRLITSQSISITVAP